MATTITDSDQLSLSDSLEVQLRKPLDAGGDNLFLSDSVRFLIGFQPHLTDSLNLSDRLQIARSISLSFADALSMSDDAVAPVLIVEIRMTASDSLSFSDSLSATPSTALDQYLRRYLNDVS